MSPSQFLTLRGYSCGLTSVVERVGDAELSLSISRARVMLGHWVVWHFLHWTASQTLDTCLDHYSTHLHCACWVKALVKDVSGQLLTSKRSITVSFNRVFPALRSSSASNVPDAVVSTVSTKSDSQARFRDLCLSILAQWLGLQPTSTSKAAKPSPNLWDIQGGFIHFLASMHKPALFLLPEVHQLFTTPVPYGFSRMGTVNGAVLPTIVRNNLLYADDRAKLLDKASVSLESTAPDIVHAVMSCETESDVSQLMPHLGKDVFVCAASNFIRSARPFMDEDLPLNDQCQWIASSEDQRNPLREHSKSRSIFTNSSSINLDFLRTRGGLFSTILFRGITYNSDFLFKYQLVAFASLEDWMSATKGIASKKICNMKAYGARPISGRSKDLASSYWDKTANWETWLRDNPNPSFTDLHQFIHTCNFNQVGDLLALLVAEDLYYGGICGGPDPHDFAKEVLKMGKGAFKAFKHFNILPDSTNPSSVQNINAFVDAYQAVLDNLTISGDEDLLPDIIVFEHLCCKIFRAWYANILPSS